MYIAVLIQPSDAVANFSANGSAPIAYKFFDRVIWQYHFAYVAGDV